MNKVYTTSIYRKACFTACLFLLHILCGQAQEWQFKDYAQQAYDHVLNLQIPRVHEMLTGYKTVEAAYILGLAEAIELLTTEDVENFSAYEQRFNQRLEQKLKGTDAQFQFLHAELRLQWAFIYLKFGHELDAALNLRESYQIATECREKNPDFIPIRKTTALLEVIIGSVPEKYNWVLGLMGMDGAIKAGLTDLEVTRHSNSSVAAEADILYALLQGFVFQKPGVALDETKAMLQKDPGNKLLRFLTASLAIKNSESEYALSLLDSLTLSHTGLHLYYDDYLRGEVYLHKGEYQNAIHSYRWFLNHYKGQNYIKDAYYKIGLCYLLNGSESDAKATFKTARTKGKDVTEADKHAARRLADKDLPNIKLSKVRYFTDGGYYEKATDLLTEITSLDLRNREDEVNYLYRKARLEHKQNNLAAARTLYQQVMDASGNENWYYAPNACLQLGYLAMDEGRNDEAKILFTRALRYDRYEYKNSIDSKAKTALTQLKTR